MFSLTIDTGNDAMRLPSDIADSLTKLAEQVAATESYADSGTIRDINGNTVGRWEYQLDLTSDE